jgi:hypothetical protein
LWANISKRTTARTKDELYALHSKHVFDTLVVDKDTDPALAAFVEETKKFGPKFSNYKPAQLESFISRIYELR